MTIYSYLIKSKHQLQNKSEDAFQRRKSVLILHTTHEGDIKLENLL